MYANAYSLALLGSLLLGAAGTLTLAAMAVGEMRHRRGEHDDERPPVRMRASRRADAVALVCFAGAAALAMLSVVQHARLSDAAARAHRSEVDQQIQALEKKLEDTEARMSEKVSTAINAPGWRERITRIEQRLVNVEHRSRDAARSAVSVRGAEAPRRR
jgi:hypothetical protein